MRCDEVEQLISDSLDGGRSLDDELRRHVDGCASCAAFERDCLELDTLLMAGRGVAPAAAPRRRIARVLVLGGLAAAAVVVLAMLPFWRLGPRTDPKHPHSEPQPMPRLVLPQDIVERTSDVVETVAMAPIRREMAFLADDARTATRSLLSCLPSPLIATSTRSVQ